MISQTEIDELIAEQQADLAAQELLENSEEERMKDFCKLYQDDEFGQILVMIDDFEATGPEIRVSFAMSGYGICSEAFKFTDDDEGWDKAEAGFARFTFEDAWCICNRIDKQLRVLGV